MRKILLKILFSSLGFLLVAEDTFAQDPQLSQFYASPIYTNPAFVGTSRKIRFASNARSQYIGLNNNYKTAVVSLDAYLGKFNSGLGVIATLDEAGDGNLRTISFGAVYSYGININRNWSVNAGILAEVKQKNYDFSKFIFGDQLDPIIGFLNIPSKEPQGLIKRTFTNFGTGILVYNPIFYGGFAVHNLFEPNQSFYDEYSSRAELLVPRRYTGHAGVNIYLSKSRNEQNRTMLSPNILFMAQKQFYQVNIGMYYKKQALSVGAWFRQTSRNADAVIFLVGIRFPNFRMGYSYDLTVSSASTATVGSHEVSLGFELKTKQKQSPRGGKPIKCPEI